ncbi:unnamed protein product, partial [marine sediment metagenome]
MADINTIQDEIIEDFSFLDDWLEKYTYLIELGNDLEPLDPQYKTDQYLIKGCQSQVWFNMLYEDGVVKLC